MNDCVVRMTWILALVTMSACGAPGRDNAPAASSGGSTEGTASPGGTVSGSGWTMYPDGVRSAVLPSPGEASAGGQVRIGMTGAQARAALALPPSPESGAPNECAFLEVPWLPVKLYFMLVSDTLVRIDVRDSTVVTLEGARVGSSEARISELYAERVTTQPHKYTSGHYLVVTSPGDAVNAMVFETDGERVTNFRVGRKREAGWVEGCS